MADADKGKTTRRDLLKSALGRLGSFLGPVADALGDERADDVYQVVDRRVLPAGGVNLFLAVSPDLSRDELKALGDRLRERFRGQPTVIAEIFDDPEAARTARAGAGAVGAARFAAAVRHQKASYYKSLQASRHIFILRQEPIETVCY